MNKDIIVVSLIEAFDDDGDKILMHIARSEKEILDSIEGLLEMNVRPLDITISDVTANNKDLLDDSIQIKIKGE